jgi:hypothetical protein
MICFGGARDAHALSSRSDNSNALLKKPFSVQRLDLSPHDDERRLLRLMNRVRAGDDSARHKRSQLVWPPRHAN